MASYPTSVKSFAARSAGQTIASAHMNDVQDEINAIEAGLLQGSAPLNSSNSTVVSLSAGPSTVANLAVSALKIGAQAITVPSGESTALALSTGATLFLLASTGASTAAISTVSGLDRGPAVTGDLVLVTNAGSPTISFTHVNSSVASTRAIVTPQGLSWTLATHEGGVLVFDGSNWRVIAKL